MADCPTYRALLGRAAEGELSPREAIDVAAHVEDCTGCRIVLARERRLCELLDRELDDGPAVDSGFACEVMARLPDGPPPGNRRRRLFRIAAWLLPFAMLAWIAGGAAAMGVGTTGDLPRLAFGDGQSMAGAVQKIAAAAAVIASGVDSRWDGGARFVPHSLTAALRTSAPLALAAAISLSLLLLAARRLARTVETD